MNRKRIVAHALVRAASRLFATPGVLRNTIDTPQVGARILILLLASLPALAQLPAPVESAIDKVVQSALADPGVPSVSIAVVKDGKLAYVHAYGDARLQPRRPADPSMRYKIASNSKQITATAVLLLAEEGKLSLDDRVSRFMPSLTRAGDVTIRQLLSHTSGYQDYYPLDYVTPLMARETTAERILDLFARKPLDFEPGTKWQYSNTNYVIAGQIIEKVAGKPLFDFLRERVFDKLGMKSPIDVDRTPWSAADPAGYTRFGLGPLRPVVPEGSGWLYAAGELAMSAHDLALWDISLMEGSILKPESLRDLTTDVKLADGKRTGYALGISVGGTNGHRKWAHTGGASGYLSSNFTRPDERISVTVLTNGETPAHQLIARRIEEILLPAVPTLDVARRVFLDLQQGRLDRSLFTDDGNSYFTAQARADLEKSLKPLGEPVEFRETAKQDRGGMTERTYFIRAGGKSLRLSAYFTPEGKLAQYLITPAQ
jgi:CubicO group peptidase (beta-lactamase class C family)